MAEEIDHFINIEIEDRNRFVLPTPEEAKTWLENYKQVWSWAQPHTQRGNQPIPQAAQEVSNFIAGVENPLNQLEANPQNRKAIGTQLEGHFKSSWKRGWQPDSDPRSQFILEQKDTKGEQPALMALAFFLKLGFQVGQLDQALFLALLDAAVFDGKMASLKPSTKAAISKSVASSEEELSKLREQREKHDQSWVDQLKSITDTLTKHDTNLQNLHDTRSTSLDEFVAQTKSDIEAFKKAHREEINLKEPVTFWAGKQRTSFWASIILGLVFVGGLIGVGNILVGESKMIYEGLKLGDKIEYWRVAGMILLGGLAFWFLRILSQIFLSQLHAWSDAQERVVMVKTYLSLLQDEKALDGNDRRLILEALFRPSPSGIIKDDGVSPAMFDLISRLK
jgi:hypothetical protein